MTMTFERRLRDRGSWEIGDACSAAKALELLSTRTVFLVIRECFYGTTRFEEFVTRIGTSAPAVSRALKQLEAAGVVSRRPYREPGQRARDEYRLTDAGEDLLPVLLSLIQWGDAHLQHGRPPLSFFDAQGRKLGVQVSAEAEQSSVNSSDIEIRYNRR